MLDLFGNEYEINETKKKDWSGNAKAVFTCNGARNYAKEDRQSEDFYATEPRAVEELLENEKFSETILEPCVGQGHIADVLTRGGVQVCSKRYCKPRLSRNRNTRFFNYS